MAVEKRKLGKTDIEVTPVGLGCWQFGMTGGMKLYQTPVQDEINRIVKAALDGGINWFDTAETYGNGRSELALSRALLKAGRVTEAVVATKWWPMVKIPFLEFPIFPRSAESITKTISKRLECLAPCHIDLLQVHFPYSSSPVELQMDRMAELVKEKKVRAVGVSNFSVEQMERAHAALAKHGIPLASNQVRFSLGYRKPDKTGLVESAKKLGITLIAYFPLDSGLLTGKFHKNPALLKKVPVFRRTVIRRRMDITRPLVNALEALARKYSCSAAEVALSWTVNFHGNTFVAIPGATRTEHVKQNTGALNLKLTGEEMAGLNELSLKLDK